MDAAMTIGAVSYLNALPLIHRLPHPVQTATPRNLLAQLLKKELSLAMLSTVCLFQYPELYLVPSMGICSKGAVQSVRLFFNKPCLTICDIKTFSPSPESNTANMLARVLLPPAAVGTGYQEGVEAEVVIGDAAMTRADPHGSVDLGELWTERTGLPFVFAAWISRHPKIPKALWEELMATKARNLGALDRCISDSPLLPELSLEAKRRYLRDNIHYDLGDLEMAGLQKFREECVRRQLLPDAYPIQLTEITPG